MCCDLLFGAVSLAVQYDNYWSFDEASVRFVSRSCSQFHRIDRCDRYTYRASIVSATEFKSEETNPIADVPNNGSREVIDRHGVCMH